MVSCRAGLPLICTVYIQARTQLMMCMMRNLYRRKHALSTRTRTPAAAHLPVNRPLRLQAVSGQPR